MINDSILKEIQNSENKIKYACVIDDIFKGEIECYISIEDDFLPESSFFLKRVINDICKHTLLDPFYDICKSLEPLGWEKEESHIKFETKDEQEFIQMMEKL